MEIMRIMVVSILITILTACSTTKPAITVGTNPAKGMATMASTAQLRTAAEINIKLGLHYLQQRDIAQAKIKLLLAIAQSPNYFLAYDAMAYFLEITGEISAAEKYYKQAIALAAAPSASALPTALTADSQNQSLGIGVIGASHNNYGTFLYRQQRCHEALTHFMLAAQDPSYLNIAAAYKNAGFAALCINDKNAAQQYFNKSIGSEPALAKYNSESEYENVIKARSPQAE
jgi:type IV pilus assembly protein PilF